MKVCRDCMNCKLSDLESDTNMGFAQCVSPKNVEIVNRVNGEIARRYKFCSSQRSGSWFDAYINRSCGPQGRWFELKGTK